MTNQWFRFYQSALDDPKVQRLPGDVFKGWVNILCLAARSDGSLPSIDDISFSLRLGIPETESLINALCHAGLLDNTDDGFEPHNWGGRQFSSDRDSTALERKRRQRARNTKGNVTRDIARDTPVTDFHVTENVTRLEQNRTEQIQSRAEQSASHAQYGRFAPEDWNPDPAIERMARVQKGVDREHELSQFRLHEFSNGKQDWDRAWAQWLNRARPRDAPQEAKPLDYDPFEILRQAAEDEKRNKQEAAK